MNKKVCGVGFTSLPSDLVPCITIYNDKVYCDILDAQPPSSALVQSVAKVRAKKGLPTDFSVNLVKPGSLSAPAPGSDAAAGAAS